MKYQGLQKILNMITQDPSSLVINRYISLVRDINNDEDKIIAIQELAIVMLDIDPQETLKYALCVFENNQSLDSLKIIYKAVTALGKTDKASVIKQEIDRLEKIQLEEHKIKERATQHPSLKAFSKVEASTPSINDIFKDSIHTETNDNRVINSDPTVLIDSNDKSFSISKSKEFNTEASKTLYKDDKRPTSTPKTTILPPVPQAEDKRTNYDVSSTVLLDNDNLQPLNTSKTQILEEDPISNSTNIPNTTHIPTPPNTSESNSVDNTSEVLIELFDFYWKNNLFNEAKNLLDSTSNTYSKSSWWLARSSAISKKIEDLNHLKESSSTIIDTNKNENENTSLNEDEIFWNNVDNLMKEGNYRKALSNIRSELFISTDKNSSWNLNLYKRINIILNALGYHSISWNSSLDKDVLYTHVMNYIPQKISTTAIL